MANFLSPSEQEIQDYIDASSGGDGMDNSPGMVNPQAAPAGSRVANQQAKRQQQGMARFSQQQQQPVDGAGYDADQQAKVADQLAQGYAQDQRQAAWQARKQATLDRQQQAESDAEQERQVRLAESQGQVAAVDPNTNRKVIRPNADGSPMYQIGPVGAPFQQAAPVQAKAPPIDPNPQAQPVPATGAVPSPAPQPSAWKQSYRNAQGEIVQQDVPTKTDPKTAQTYIETPDEFGRPVRRVVGMDETAGAKLQLEADTARHGIDMANWQIANESFKPVYAAAEKDYAKAQSKMEAVNPQNSRIIRLNGKWMKLDPNGAVDSDGNPDPRGSIPLGPVDAAFHQKRIDDAAQAFAAAKQRIDPMQPGYDALKARGEALELQRLQLAKRKIQLESGLPDDDGGAAIELAKSQGLVGSTPQDDAVNKLVQGPPAPGKAGTPLVSPGAPTQDADATKAAFHGFSDIKGVMVEKRNGWTALNDSKGHWFASINDDDGQSPYITLAKGAITNPEVAKRINMAGTDGMPLYLADNPARQSLAKEAEWMAQVFQASHDPDHPDEAAKADRLAELQASPAQIAERVKSGEISKQTGEAIAKGVYNTTPQTPEAQTPKAGLITGKNGEVVKPEGKLATFGREVATGALKAIGTAVGGAAGLALGVEGGPLAFATMLGGSALGAAAGDWATKTFMGKDWSEQNELQRQANAQSHAVVAMSGSGLDFAISVMGGGGVGALVKSAEGKVIGRALTNAGKTALEKGASSPMAERVLQSGAIGLRTSLADAASEKYVDGKDVSFPDVVSRGALTFAATGIFPPAKALGAIALMPMAKAVLMESLKRAVGDGVAMTMAGSMYDAAVHGKPVDMNATAKELGGTIEGFALFNLVMGTLHARGAAMENIRLNKVAKSVDSVIGDKGEAPVSRDELNRAAGMFAVTPEEGKNAKVFIPKLAEHVLINRDIAQNDVKVKEAAAALSAVPDGDLEAKIEAEGNLRDAQAKANHADLTRAVMKVNSGIEVGGLSPSELNSFGYKRTADNKGVEPMTPDELQGRGLTQPLIKAGADGSLIITDEAQARVGEASARAAGLIQGTETQQRDAAQNRFDAEKAKNNKSNPAGNAPKSTPAPVAPGDLSGENGPAAMEHALYVAHQVANPGAPAVHEVVDAAYQRNHPVSSSMAAAAAEHGVHMPDHYDPQGPIHRAKETPAAAALAKGIEQKFKAKDWHRQEWSPEEIKHVNDKMGSNSPFTPERLAEAVRQAFVQDEPISKGLVEHSGVAMPDGFHVVGNLVLRKQDMPIRKAYTPENNKTARDIALRVKYDVSKTLKGLKLEVVDDPSMPVSGGVIAYLDSGSIKINIADVAANLASGNDPKSELAILRNFIVRHEVVHIADFGTIRKIWESGDKKISLGEFYKKFNIALGRDYQKVPKLYEWVKQIYDQKPIGEAGQSTWDHLSSEAKAGETTRAIVEEILNPTKEGKEMISELFRMEKNGSPFLEHIKKVVETLTEWVKNIIEHDPSSPISNELRAHLASVLEFHGKLMNGDPAEPSSESEKTPSKDSEPQTPKQHVSETDSTKDQANAESVRQGGSKGDAQKGQVLDQQPAVGEENSPAADASDYHAVPVGDGSTVNIVKNGDVFRKNIPADEAQRHIDELKAVEDAPKAVIWRAISEVASKDSRLKDQATRLELDSIEGDLAEVLATMPPGDRAAHAVDAIDQWLAERPEASDKPGDDTQKAKAKRSRAIDTPAEREARKKIYSGGYLVFQKLSDNGVKIEPRESIISILLSNKKKGAILSQSQFDRIKADDAEYNGYVQQNHFDNNGNGKVARAMLRYIMAKPGEGMRPNRAVEYLGRGLKVDDLWHGIYEELKRVVNGTGRPGQMKDPNRDNWTPQEIADYEAGQREGIIPSEGSRQNDDFHEANAPENGTEKEVSSFTEADVGSTVTVDGEPMKVSGVHVNEDTGEVESVTLDDHKRFGRQVLEGGDVVYIEHEEPKGQSRVSLEDMAASIEHGLGKGDDLAAKVRAFLPYEDRLPDSDKADLRSAIEADSNRRADNVISAGEWQKNHQPDMTPRAAALQRLLDGHTLESLKALLNKWMPPDEARLASSPEQNNEDSFKREKAAILAAAPRGKDGHPLAHNGERSNLSEDQWATVRTGKFLKYFGDWVAAAKRLSIDNTSPVKITTGKISKNDAETAYRNIGTVDFKDGRKVDLVRGIFGKLAGHKHGELIFRTVPQFKQLAATAIHAYSESERSPAKGSIIKEFHNYVSKAVVDGDEYFVRFTVQELKDSRNQLHNAFVSDAEIVKADNLRHSGIIDPATRTDVSPDHKLHAWWHSVNPESVSKAVDANGEPLVVYHGTSSDFDTFEMSKFGQTDSGWYGEGFYFTGRKEQAESYAKSSAARTKGTPRIVQAFLNIRDPFVTDRVGEQPDESEKGDGTIYYGYLPGYRKAYEVPEELVVPRQNQIKSATDNNGEFSEDASILRSSPEPTRFRPKSMVEFKKPFRGPSGAALVAYDWKNQLVDGVDKRGEDKVERVSDWNKAATNWQTGREIVHHFHVDTPDGKTHVVSLESALKLLGYTSANGIASRPVKALASMVKTRATLTMEAEALRPVVDEQNSTNERFRQERAALRNTPMPEPVFRTTNGTPEMLVDGEMERFGHWANREAYAASSERDKRDLADRWRDREAAKRAGGNGWGTESGKLSDLEARIAKMDRKIQEQSAAGANTPLDPEAITREEHQDAASAQAAASQPDLFSSLLKEPPGPLSVVKERAQAAHNAQPEGSKARDVVAADMAKREGRTVPPAFKSGQGVMDFGASGGGGKKGQQEFGLMASPDTRQRAFDFGTTSSFATKNQQGFDFTAKKVDEAAKDTDTNPTPAQIEAGNYAKGKVRLHGMSISIENAKGSTRSGTDKAGKPWSVEMQAHYGYFTGTEGRDKDHVDVFIGPDPSSTKAFVVNQINPSTSRFDEHKVMLGYGSRQEAIAGYKANYAPGWKGLGSIEETNVDSLREWLKTEDTKKPAQAEDFKPQESAQQDAAKPEEPQQAAVETLQGVTEKTLQTELEKGKTSGNFALVTASKARLAVLTGDPEIIHKTLLEEMGIRAEVIKKDGDIFMSVPESHGFNAVMRMLRGAFQVMAAMTEDGKMAIRIMGVARDVTTEDSSAVATPAIEPGTPDFRLLPVADKKVVIERKKAERAGDIGDFGEKIGGARKDTAIKTGTAATKKPADSRPAWARRYQIGENIASSTPGEVGRFSIRDLKNTDWRGQPRTATDETFATREEAEKAIPLIAVFRNHKVRMVKVDGSDPAEYTYSIWRDVTDHKRVKVVKQDFPTREEAVRFVAEHAADIIETKTSYREELFATPEKAVRSGKDRRTGPATSEMFQNDFGFRGVEFGNWMRQTGDSKERQEVLNHAYDGLHDLADVLGVPAKAMSLNGELGLAFGARGQGLQGAKAHYERDYATINLTKMSGAGSLAHEWFHALDHYLGRQDGKAAGEMVKNADGNMVFKAKGREDDYVSHGFTYNSKVREAVRDAYKDVMKTIATKAVEFVHDTANSEKFVQASRTELEKKLAEIRADLTREPHPEYEKRRKPATESQLEDFDRRAAALLDGKGLETKFRDPDSKARHNLTGRYTNDTLEAISGIHKSVTGRAGFGSTTNNGPLDYLRGSMTRYQQRIAMLESAAKSEVNVKKAPTDYAMNAKRIDQGGTNDYWSTPHELAARAFSAYVEDKVTESGNKSEFLSYGSDNRLPEYRMLNVRPFPEGAERVAIDGAFDKLFKTIKAEPTDKGVALMSSPEEDRTDRPAFYSQLARVIEAKVPNNATPQQVIATLLGGQVKAEEIKWSGIVPKLQELAAANGGKVSKKALQEYLDGEGAVRFEEITLGKNKPIEWKDENDRSVAKSGRLNFRIEKLQPNGKFRLESGSGITSIHASLEEAKAEAADIRKMIGPEAQDNPTKFSAYQLPGGEHYREIIATTKPKRKSFSDAAKGYYETFVRKGGNPSWEELGEAKRLDMIELTPEVAFNDPGFRSSHFPDAPNYVAHMRVQDRKLPDGSATLHSLEAQNDASNEYLAARDNWVELNHPGNKFKDIPKEEQDQAAVTARKEVPDTPFQGNPAAWIMALFKRQLAMAVKENKDSVSWDTGKTVADRFNLSKHVDEVMWIKDDPEEGVSGGSSTGMLKAKKDGKIVISEIMPPSELENYVGKDVAQRLINSPVESQNSSGHNVRILKGLDLNVGGEDKSLLYDQIAPKEIGKYVKQWGAKVEPGVLKDAAEAKNRTPKYEGPVPTLEDVGKMYSEADDRDERRQLQYIKYAMNDGESFENAIINHGSESIAKLFGGKLTVDNPDTPIWKVEITPEMRKGVDAGQALFSSPEDHENTQNKAGKPGEKQLDSAHETDRRIFQDVSPEPKRIPRDRLQAAIAHLGGSEGIGGAAKDQKAAIVDWARSEGVLIDRFPFRLDGPSDDGGSEHHVFFDPKSKRWIKLTRGTGEGMGRFLDPESRTWGIKLGTPPQYLQSLADRNALTGDDTQVHAVFQDRYGNVGIVTSQPDIQGEPMGADEIATAMESAGFKSLGDSAFYRASDNTLVLDLNDTNAVRSESGEMLIYDGSVIHPNAEELSNLGIDASKIPPAILRSSPSPESTDSQPDLFTAANAPDAREKLGEVKAGTMNALGAYKALTAKREKLGSLSGEEENQLLQAEKALGQKLAFDMEAVKGKDDSQPVAPQAKSTRPAPSRGVQQGLNLGEDGPVGQMMLLSSPEGGETDAQKAARQAIERMPPVFHDVFNAITKGDSQQEVRDRFKLSDKQVTNILNQVRARMQEAAGAAGPDGLKPVMQGDKFKGGRPDLALSDNSRVAAVDQIRNANEIPDKRGHDMVNAEAKAMLAKDYQGTYDKLLDAARARRQMSDTEVAATKHIISNETLSGRIQTPEERTKIAMLIHGYRDIGTDTARALAMRVDPDMTPAERNARFIAEALFTPDAKTRERLRKAKAGESESVLAGWMKRVDGIKSELLAQGINLDATLAEYHARAEARKEAESESPRAAKVIDEEIKKLTNQQKCLITSIRDGALLTEAAMTSSMDKDEAAVLYSDFFDSVRSAMARSAKRFIEGSLASSPVDVMNDILAELGFPHPDLIDDRKPGFVDRRNEKSKAPRKERPAKQEESKAPRKERPAKQEEPKKPTLVTPSPEAQAVLDAAWERFKSSDFKGTEAFAKDLQLYPINETRGTWDPTVANREKSLFPQPINESKGTFDPTAPNTEKSLFPKPINERTGEFKGRHPEDLFIGQKIDTDLVLQDKKADFHAKYTQLEDGTMLERKVDSKGKVTWEVSGGTFDIHDPIAVKRVMDAFALARGGKMDAMMEYWRMALLTGPHTAVVNATSHALHALYNALPRRAVEATLNNVLGIVGQGSDKAATFGEFVPMVRHLNKAAQVAGRMAINSWKMENRVFEAYAKATPLELGFSGVGGEYIPPALGGAFGKVMRSISFRAMTTADEFIKGFYGHLEAAAQAHRMASSEEKLTGSAYESRLNELMQPGSEAWIRAFDKTMTVGFQDHLDGNNPQAIHRLDQLSQLVKHGRAMPWIGRPLMFFFPFIDTPTNLVKLATEMSPIGAFLAVVDGTRALKQRIFRGDLTPMEAHAEAAKLYDRARFVKDLTNQTIGLAAGYALMGMVSPDPNDDSGLPIITGTVPYKTTKRGERDNAMATMPPMTIRIPGTKMMFDYSRFEPFSMAMAASVDGLVLYNRNGGMKPGVVSEWLSRFKDQMKDKTFLQGMANLTNALEDPDRFAERLTSGIVTSFVPNLIRQVVKEADPTQRNLHPKAADGFFQTLANDVGYSVHPQSAPAKIDVWGNDVPRHRGDLVGGTPTSDFLFRVIDPAKTTFSAKSNPIDLYIFNYNLQTADSAERIAINPIPDSMSIHFPGAPKPQKVALTEEQYTEVNRDAGKLAKDMLGYDWDWRNPTAEGAKRIKDAVRHAQESMEKRMRAELMAAGPPR